jgi:GNAT superfamily N-acetyltransferase
VRADCGATTPVLVSDVDQLRRAERALHRRASWACAAAVDAGVPGRFRAWEQAGLLAVSATDPALGFLSTVSGVARESVPAVIDLVDAPVWNGVQPTVAVPAELGEVAGSLLPAAGLVRVGDRVLAVKRVEHRPARAAADVIDAGEDDRFLDVLLAGYEVDGVVAAFIAAEHRLPMMRRFLVMKRGTPIAAAAMTIHGEVAVLGGASTLPAYRKQGAQSRLLQHRLRVAAEAGCALAVATARPESVSSANLRRAGFRIHRRSAWVRTGSHSAARPS